MSRKLVFVNASSDTLTIDTDGPIFPVKIDGLGTPETMIQEQKAPFQDGTTYIDALFQPRTITVEVAILKPNNFTEIDTYRRELAKKLNPKLGQGTLTYTTEGGAVYKIAAIPMSSPSFPNKDYRDPYARAQVTFYCNDPYWKKTTADTINLPTASTSAESVINGAASNFPCVIQLANGDLFAVYYRTSDAYIVSRTYSGGSWSGETVINAASSGVPCVIQLANGDLFLVYSNASSYIVSRTYTSSWSAEATINAASSGIPSVIQLANGNLFLTYTKSADSSLQSRTYTTSWSGESLVSASAQGASVIQRSDGTLVAAYRKESTGYIAMRTYDSAWSDESTINAADSQKANLLELINGALLVFYKRESDDYVVSRTGEEVWSSESIISNTASSWPSVIQLADESLYFAYVRTSDSYIVSKIRSVTPVAATVTGDYNTPISVTFTGPSTNPRIVNADTLEYIRLNTTLAATDTFVVNTAFGNKTVTLTQGGIVKNGIAFLDIGSTFFQLTPGANTVYFEDDAVASTATATMTWTERYVGT